MDRNDKMPDDSTFFQSAQGHWHSQVTSPRASVYTTNVNMTLTSTPSRTTTHDGINRSSSQSNSTSFQVHTSTREWLPAATSTPLCVVSSATMHSLEDEENELFGKIRQSVRDLPQRPNRQYPLSRIIKWTVDELIHPTLVETEKSRNKSRIASSEKSSTKMKERALNEMVPVGMIYDEELAKATMTSSALAIFPTNTEIYQGINKVRRRATPALPQSCLFTIPDIYKSTIDGNRFLLCDESRVRRERLLLFSSDDQLDLLFDSPMVFMDGTFSKSPPHFCQIYILHAVNFDICLPCVFGLLVNKKSITYKQLFFNLKQIALERGKCFSPEVIITDFESGVLPVLKSEFPSAKHLGCFFHFCQAIYRQIQFLGMQKKYTTDETLRSLCRKLMALALMPKDKVVCSFEEIQYDAYKLPDQPMDDLLEYFQDNWMTNIDSWNVSESDVRTNNNCEGYHNRMNCRLIRNHPNVWFFFNFLQREEKRVTSILAQWSSGASKKKNTRKTAIEKRINTLYKRYTDDLIGASTLLTGLSLFVAKKCKSFSGGFQPRQGCFRTSKPKEVSPTDQRQPQQSKTKRTALP
ncbi:unnamed protein product [Adineta ricciae]|uniref:MULE transposase domain-containing protein n=1 Tax=Adineta ricciae TaxID=249248 RepID=A0A816AYH4_ADIRI|nr:unnamed protein product [Adineta ricciae]